MISEGIPNNGGGMSLTGSGIFLWAAKVVGAKVVGAITDPVGKKIAKFLSSDFEEAIKTVVQEKHELKGMSNDLWQWFYSGDLCKQIINLNEPNRLKLVPALVPRFKQISADACKHDDSVVEKYLLSIFAEFEALMRSKDPRFAADRSVEVENRMDNLEIRLDQLEGAQSRLPRYEDPTQDPKVVEWLNRDRADQKVKEISSRLDSASSVFASSEISAALILFKTIRDELLVAEDFPGKDALEFRTLVSISECHLRLEQFDLAKEDINAALRLQPNNATALANSAHLDYVQFKDLSAAAKRATRAMAIAPENEYVVAVGTTCIGIGLGIQALAAILKDIDHQVVLSPNVQAAIGELRHARGEFEKAILKYRRALQTTEPKASTHYMLAQSLYQLGRRKLRTLSDEGILATNADKSMLIEAEQEATHAIDLSMHSNDRVFRRRAYQMRSVIRFALQKHSEGLADCDSADALGSSEQTQRVRGEHLALSDRFEEAIAVLEKLSPNDRPDISQILGYCYYRQSEYEQAIVHFSKVVDEEKDSDHLDRYIQSLWLTGIDHHKKKAYLLASAMRRRGTLKTIFMDGVEYARLYEQQHWAAMIPVLLDLIKVNPDNPHFQISLLGVYLTTNKREPAIQQLAALKSNFSESHTSGDIQKLEQEMRRRTWIR